MTLAILTVEQVQQALVQHQQLVRYPLDLLVAEVNKVQRQFPEGSDPVARLMAVARPVVEVAMMEAGYFEDARPTGKRGRPRLARAALMTILLFAQLKQFKHDRQVARELERHPAWVKALGLKKAPDHDTLGKFRNSLSPAFFETFFHKMTAFLFAFGILDGDSAMVVDSAPVEADQNFARSNAVPKIDEGRLRAFFDALDLAPALRLMVPPAGHGRPAKFPREALLRFLMFEKICGFLSRSQALKYLAKHPSAAEVLGFDPKDPPTSANVVSFLDRTPPVNFLMRPLVGQITDFFDAQPTYDEEDPLSFFFWDLADREAPP